MNEQRQQAYLNLIQDLLSSSSDEELDVLTSNQELLDAGFLQAVEAVGEMASQQGNGNTAARLRNLATELRNTLDLPPQANLEEKSEPVNHEDSQTYLQFLIQVLQAIADSGGDAQVVYPLLTANQDKFNARFVEAFQSWAGDRFSRVEQQEEAQALARVIINFIQLIELFPLENKSISIEISIIGWEVVLTVFTLDKTPPEIWASMQKILAEAYRTRIKRDKTENLEKAISYFQAALQVFTREDFPEQWANAQLNLGVTY